MTVTLIIIDVLCVVLVSGIYLTEYTEKKIRKYLNKERPEIDRLTH